MRPRTWIAGAALSMIAACMLEPEVGPLLAGTCKDADGDPASAVSFAQQIRPLINRPISMGGCGCHLPSAGGSSTGIQLSGLNLGTMASLRAGGLTSGGRIVIPNQPCESIIYQKIEDAPPFGSRMPLGGPPFLSEEEEELLHDWIAEGALDN